MAQGQVRDNGDVRGEDWVLSEEQEWREGKGIYERQEGKEGRRKMRVII